MILREQVDIARPPEKVWEWVADPERTPRWNEHCKSVEAGAFGRPGPGWTYAATYQLSGPPKRLRAVIEDFSPPRRLAVRQTGDGFPPGGSALEVYELERRADGGTRLTQTVTIEYSGVSQFWRAVIWFIRRFGRPTGQPFLDKLRDLIEAEPAV